MSESTQSNPVAIPWTPDNMDQNSPALTQSPLPLQGAVPSQSHGQNGYAQPYQAEIYHGQPSAAYQSAPQAPLPYGQPGMGQPQQQAYHSAGVHNTLGQDIYDHNVGAHSHQRPQPQQPYQQFPTAHMPAHQAAIGMLPRSAAEPLGRSSGKTKGFLGRLLKRSPRPSKNESHLNIDQLAAQTQSRFKNRLSPQGQSQIPNQGQDPLQPQYLAAEMGGVAQSPSQTQGLPKAKGSSVSLFNKNFFLGAVTGIIVGVFVLPILINMIAGDTSPQTQAQVQPTPFEGGSPSDATLNTEETFLDAAIAADDS